MRTLNSFRIGTLYRLVVSVLTSAETFYEYRQQRPSEYLELTLQLLSGVVEQQNNFSWRRDYFMRSLSLASNSTNVVVSCHILTSCSRCNGTQETEAKLISTSLADARLAATRELVIANGNIKEEMIQ
eukprot:scaffold5468_cov101-Skeletonema_dohrnii-CCMP3373.AAC.2